MNKKISLKAIAIIAPIALVCVTLGAFAFGKQQSNNADNYQQSDADKTYAKSLGELQDKLSRITNDYESACYNYQTLYAAYDELYSKVGAGSGIQQLARVDNARGNEESCYR